MDLTMRIRAWPGIVPVYRPILTQGVSKPGVEEETHRSFDFDTPSATHPALTYENLST